MKMRTDAAIARIEAIHADYAAQPFIDRIKELLIRKNESYREAGLRAGLDHQAIRRVLDGKRPTMTTCLLLADHFEVNPNEFLALAGWPTMRIFDVSNVSEQKVPPEAAEVALTIAQIADPQKRREVSKAIVALVKQYFP
ncbi:MAG TPA: helix-turn-helix transcriptional regulator [Anaerolineaceae bacterium]|nr:helix-turn-helix transcriptional regulator [Anaerolineaceae bacterium]HPN51177.1 helix-turn-helix transcriptional regulator [Anaerolineaceae bacterium]